METHQLPTEVISLIHHVKLNETGWWEKAFQGMITSLIGSNSNKPTTRENLYDIFKTQLTDHFEKSKFDQQFDMLLGRKTIVEISKGEFVLSTTAFENFNKSFLQQRQIEDEALKRFTHFAVINCPELDATKLWEDFNKKLMMPLIKELGARMYELISGNKSFQLQQHRVFIDFMDGISSERDKIGSLISAYLDFKNTEVKSYILRQLNYYFFIEASSLTPQALEKIYALSKSQTNLKVFADTNFLLSVLDLHDNPSNDATSALLDLLVEIKNKVNVKIYVSPFTIDEFKNLLGKIKDSIKNTRPTLNFAKAVDNHESVSGILRKYYQKCVERGTILSPEEYFEPYLNNVTVFLRSKGIEIYNGNVDKYSTDSRVIDDLNTQVEYRYAKYERNNPGKTKDELENVKLKIYDKFNHDCKLWYLVKDKRPGYTDSPKDIVDWIITLDFNLLEFDHFKQETTSTSPVGLCLHPNEFISMLQFWAPRSEKFENAIFENFRLPFLFHEIDLEAEKVSVEILKSLSQYGDSKEYSVDLVSEILTNKAIRHKIKPSNTTQANAELIKEEVYKLYESSKSKLAEKDVINLELKGELTNLKRGFDSLAVKIDDLSSGQRKLIEEHMRSVIQFRIKESESGKREKESVIAELDARMEDFEKLRQRASTLFEGEKRKLAFRLNAFLSGNKQLYYKKAYENMEAGLLDVNKMSELSKRREEIAKELNEIRIPVAVGNVVVFCENQNAEQFNKLGFEGISFFPENNSAGVFIKVVSNPTAFGIRDRDYLTTNEVAKLQAKHKNYIILDYYCFENYLYHPDNIKELELPGLSVTEYIAEIFKQRDEQRDRILTIIKTSRRGYQEFKITEDKFEDKDDTEIINNLSSNDIEVLLKSFDMKRFFKREILVKHHLPFELLTSTNWFKKQITLLLEVKA